MINVEFFTNNAQLDLQGKFMVLPESPVIGDFVHLKDLFTADELETAEYEVSKQGCVLQGQVTERIWYLNDEAGVYVLLLKLELEKDL